MIPMKRKERQVVDEAEIGALLETCKVCRVGLCDDEGVYIVPMSYGYDYAEGKLTFYFHGAKRGRKTDAILKNNAVGFEIDRVDCFYEGKVPCAFGCSYESLIGNGTIEILEDPAERRYALEALMRHHTDQTFEFTPLHLSAVSCLRLTASDFTVKKHKK